MPCNKVAVVTAKVDAEHIARLLSTDVTFPYVKAYIEAKMAEIGSELLDPSIELSSQTAQQFCFRLGGYYGLYIFIAASGEVTISYTGIAQAVLADQLKSELVQLMTALGVEMLKAEVQQFVQQNFGIEQVYQKPDGTLVLNFEA